MIEVNIAHTSKAMLILYELLFSIAYRMLIMYRLLLIRLGLP